VPTRPLQPCAEPGCPALVPRGRCARHQRLQRPPWAATRSAPLRQRGRALQTTRARIFARDGYRCAYCGAPAEVVDHVVALAHGGTETDANRVACCRACNERKRRLEARGRVVGISGDARSGTCAAAQNARVRRFEARGIRCLTAGGAASSGTGRSRPSG
jgi:5-methylcytosine-specific restriction endonuclease McrA